MSLKRKSTIVDIENAIQDINKLLKDYSDEQEKINDILDEKNALYEKLYSEGDAIEAEYKKKDKMVKDYEEKNGLKNKPITEKENFGDWTMLAIAADDERDKLIMNDKMINQLDFEINKYGSEFEIIDLSKKKLVEILMKLNSEKSNKKTQTELPRSVRFGVNDIFGMNPNNPVNIQSQAHLDKDGNPVFFEEIQGTTATDHDTEQGERMFYTGKKFNQNVEKAKYQDMREKLAERQKEAEKIFGFIPNKKRPLSSSQQSQPSKQTLNLQKLRKDAIKPMEDEKIEGGSRVKELLKRTKNILKRVEKILSKKKGTKKIKSKKKGTRKNKKRMK